MDELRSYVAWVEHLLLAAYATDPNTARLDSLAKHYTVIKAQLAEAEALLGVQSELDSAHWMEDLDENMA